MIGIAFGGDYNPEQWDPAVWREDVALMRDAGVTLATVGVFSWGTVEPKPGRFAFGWLDEVLDLLHDAGIAVDLATPTMSPPPWLSQQHPEVLPITADGRPFGVGNRLHYDPASPVYRDAAVRIASALAERYASHPALAMWHVSNEYGPVSYSPAASAAFRDWLRRRYGDLDGLNDAWYGRFWSQTYTDWDQVEVPQHPVTWSNPGRRLDFQRFTSDLLLECFVAERDAIRAFDPDRPITTNAMRFVKRTDLWRWAREMDVVALDVHPNPVDDESWVAASLHFDLMRSLKQRPWLLMEQAASGVSQWPLNVVKRPGMMRLGSYQAVAHGADAVLFFQWRASRGGHERFHSAMLPHSGPASRTFTEVAALGRELLEVAEVAGVAQTAEVAVLHDWDAWWALTETWGLPRNDFDYPALLEDHYRPYLQGHVPVDLVSQTSSLEGYRVVVIPNASLVSDAFVAELTRFVAAGGTVVCSFFSGIVDERNQVRQPAYPGAFRALAGLWIDEFWPARPGESFGVAFADGTTARADWWQDRITLEGAEALATYDDGLLAGFPSVTANRTGAGRFVHVGTRLDRAALTRLLLTEAAAAGVVPVVADAPPTVEATIRGDHLFLLNHDESAEVTVPAPRAGRDLLTGDEFAAGEPIPLAPLAVRILRDVAR